MTFGYDLYLARGQPFGEDHWSRTFLRVMVSGGGRAAELFSAHMLDIPSPTSLNAWVIYRGLKMSVLALKGGVSSRVGDWLRNSGRRR